MGLLFSYILSTDEIINTMFYGFTENRGKLKGAYYYYDYNNNFGHVIPGRRQEVVHAVL